MRQKAKGKNLSMNVKIIEQPSLLLIGMKE